jgi:hypothetical protein
MLLLDKAILRDLQISKKFWKCRIIIKDQLVDNNFLCSYTEWSTRNIFLHPSKFPSLTVNNFMSEELTVNW